MRGPHALRILALVMTLVGVCACRGKVNVGGAQGSGTDGGNLGVGCCGVGPVPDGGDPDGGPFRPPPVPFKPVAVYSSLAKVKNLLTGQPPTTAELSLVTLDIGNLKGLIDVWLATPQAQAKLLVFFGNALQQSQFVYTQLQDQTSLPDFLPGATSLRASLEQNIRESFARTALDIINSGKPLTQTATTTAFMMTPALAAFYAFIDARQMGDDMKLHDSLFTTYPSTTVAAYPGTPQIPASQSADPNSPNFMHWSITGTLPGSCPTPRNWGSSSRDGFFVWAILMGYVEQDNKPAGCLGQNTAAQFTATDFTTWSLVNVRAPAASEATTEYWNVPVLRNLQTLVLHQPRVGFFTTPAFFANWGTNKDNQARVTANQTIIAALGHSIDPSTAEVAISESSAGDLAHADPSSSCYACHQSLDPLRNFFRKSYSFSYHAQTDPVQQSAAANFAIAGVNQPGKTVADLANILVAHPLYGAAWAQKLCYYADSAPCSEDDPEFQRVVAAFASHGWDFKVLVRELFSSPLVTHAAATKTTTDRGNILAVSRYDHLCAALNARLGLTDACSHDTPTSQLAQSIPADAYSRGSEAPVVPSVPTLFYRAATEGLCWNVANRVVQNTGAKYSPTQIPAAMADFVANIMALPQNDPRATGALAILNDHYANARKAGSPALDSLRSTFTLACTSPTSTGMGL